MDNPTTIPSRRAALLVSAMVLALAGLVLLRWNEMPVGAATDDAYYVEMARSLAEGRGPVLYLHDLSGPWPPDVFPPGLPLMLAPLARLAPGSPGILKLVPLMAWAALVPLCLMWPPPSAGWARRWILTGLVLVNPWTVAYAGRIVSDLPYTAFSVGALLTYRHWFDRPGPGRFLALVLLTVAAVAVRTVGWALPVAMILNLVLARRRGPALALTAACALPLAALHMVCAPLGSGLISGGYTAQVLAVEGPSRFELVLGNALGYLAEIPAVVLPVFGEPTLNLAQGAGLGALYGPILMILGACFLVVVVRGWRHDRPAGGPGLPVLYAALYGLALVNFAGWPSGVQARLLLPLLPLLIDGVLGWVDTRAAGHRRVPMVIPVAALLAAAALFHNGFRVVRPPLEPRFDPQLGTAWLKDNSGVEETVMVRMPLKQHLHLDRPTVGFGVLGETAMDTRIARFDVRWIILGPEPMTGEDTNRGLAALLATRPLEFPLVHEDPAQLVRIHRVARPTPGRTGPSAR